MPNPTGRAAKKAAPAKKATPAGASGQDPEVKAERHVRTPLERAQSVFDKAQAAFDKVNAKLISARAEVGSLEAEAEDAKTTLDWAAGHPLLVKARKEKEAESQGEVASDTAAAGPEAEGRMRTVEIGDEAPAFADGGEIVSSVPAGEGDDEGADEAAGDAEPMPPFDFDATTAPAPASPFDFDQAASGPRNIVV